MTHHPHSPHTHPSRDMQADIAQGYKRGRGIRRPQTSKEGEPQQLSSPGERAKALERALRMVY